ncbi:hypothetical protein EI420_16420 [Vreelandella venusta]|uniref:DNA-directed RNA polymerase II n=1 Tax=Vreelandella venusta TaxID=44935 RepID=A0ABX2BFD7_9GAMM|nr:hypothetical protein EI420_16420 [Halomonas venusta]NPT32832.1 hypothetical protein [Halomonas venusta]
MAMAVPPNAFAPLPMATLSAWSSAAPEIDPVSAVLPMAMSRVVPAVAVLPMATEDRPAALAFTPAAMAFVPVAPSLLKFDPAPVTVELTL